MKAWAHSEREKLQEKKSSGILLLLVAIYSVFYSAIHSHMCEHFAVGTFQLERALKPGLYIPPEIVFKPGILFSQSNQ